MADFDGVERMLRGRSAELETRARELDAELGGLGALRDANNDDEHDPDGVPVSGEWSRLSGIRRELANEITATAAALDRLAGGVYGVCADCGNAIPPARLAARPTATLCIACAERRGRRP